MSQGHEVRVELAWCPGCRLECTVEIVQLLSDPAPVAVCLECGGGVELWWQLPTVPGHRWSAAS